MTKAHHQLHRVWIKQCEATEGIRLHHGAESAFDYVVGEKLFSYAEAALTRPEFARELPTFVSEIRRMFSREDIETLWPRIERRKRANNTRFALRNHQIRPRDEEERRCDDGQAEAIENSWKCHAPRFC